MRLADIVPARGFSRRMGRCILWAENPVAPYLLLAFALAAQAKPLETCSLSGTVVDAVTHEPLNKVNIQLVPLDVSSRGTAGTRSGPEGRFTLINLAPGRYRLDGFRTGYLQTAYGARRKGQDGAALTLVAGQAMKGIELKLIPAASIAGVVRDADGDPLSWVMIEIARKVRDPSGDVFDSAGWGLTDDRGQYRVASLGPGRYYLGAAPDTLRGSTRDHSPPSAGPSEVNLRSFYPGVQDPWQAAPIEVAAGSQITGIDLMLARSPTVRVCGRATKDTGIAGGHPSLRLEERSTGYRLLGFSQSGRTTDSGDFEFESVPPGSYLLTAKIGGTYETSTTVEVGRLDIEGVRLVVGPGADVKGRLTIEGGGKVIPGLWVVALKWPFARPTAEVASDGTFLLRNLSPGRYTVSLPQALSRGLYVKSIRSDQVDVLKDGLLLSGSGALTLDIVASSDGGVIKGVVCDAKERPAVGATVVLVPEARFRSRGDLFKTSSTDQDGRYEWKAIPPGDYKLFAWDDVEPGAWHDPDFLKEFEQKATPITIHPNGREVVRVHVLAVAIVGAAGGLGCIRDPPTLPRLRKVRSRIERARIGSNRPGLARQGLGPAAIPPKDARVR